MDCYNKVSVPQLLWFKHFQVLHFALKALNLPYWSIVQVLEEVLKCFGNVLVPLCHLMMCSVLGSDYINSMTLLL